MAEPVISVERLVKNYRAGMRREKIVPERWPPSVYSGRRPISSDSKDMTQRLGLAQALIHDPELLIGAYFLLCCVVFTRRDLKFS